MVKIFGRSKEMGREEKVVELLSASCSLMKGLKEGEVPTVVGVASSEEEDTQGDVIIQDMLDISYLLRKGYVNWNHSPKAVDQVGYVLNAEIIRKGDVARFEDMLGIALSPQSTLFVKFGIYHLTEIGANVLKMLASLPEDSDKGLGLSVEGVAGKTKEGKVVAKVMGLAVTQAPAQVNTVCKLAKALGLTFNDTGNLIEELRVSPIKTVTIREFVRKSEGTPESKVLILKALTELVQRGVGK